MNSGADSYRDSHRKTGKDYNDFIAYTPWDAYLAEVERDYLRSLFEELPKQDYSSYLDFACGTGRITSIAEKYFSICHGVDVSESMVDEARAACPRTEFVIKDLTKEPHDNEYDIVTAFRFFGNAEQELRADAFLALSRILRRGGLLVLNNHRNPYALREIAGYLTGGTKLMDLSHRKLLNLAMSSGFRLASGISIGARVFRHSMVREKVLTGKASKKFERLFSSRLFMPFSPDAIYVFRKE